MRRADVLDAAVRAVTVDRATTHGAAEDTFGAIAKVWSARLGVAVTPAQVALLLIDLKVCRAWGNPGHDDNWVDIAGYAACGGELAGLDRPKSDGGGCRPAGNLGRAAPFPSADDVGGEP